MGWFLFTIIILLLVVILYQYALNRSRSKQLQQLHDQLHHIMNDQTDEHLLMITDDKELKNMLIEINHLLDYSRTTAADHMKMEIATKKMIANMSHDLKTPLTVILGYIETIHMNPLMDASERTILLGRVYNKTLEVLELMRRFFDLSKLESGDQEIPLTQIDINEICRHNILSFYDILTAQNFQVKIEIPDESVFILGNEEALNRILNNLISNAIQHGGDGYLIGLSLKPDEEAVMIEVWDHGKGIHELHKDRIFERLYTMEDSRHRSYQNSGLGLTITKRLVEKMGGTIHVSSPPNERTVFAVRFKRLQF